MTNRAARVGGRFPAAHRFSDSGRARIRQNDKRFVVKIFLRPGDVLTALVAGAAMTTGRSTTDGADKLGAFFVRLSRLLRKGADREEQR